MSDGVTVSGGGTTAVETASMLQAGRVLAAAQPLLLGLASEFASIGADAGAIVAPAARLRCFEALEAASAAVRLAEQVEQGLRLAADRYGAIEHGAARALEISGALAGAAVGRMLRLGLLLGPTVPVGVGALTVAATAHALGLVALDQFVRSGRVDLLNDPRTVLAVRAVVSSADDVVRGFTGTELVEHVLRNDPDAPLGSEDIAKAAAVAISVAGGLPVLGADVRVQRRQHPVGVAAPPTLEHLAARIPPADPGLPQVRVERYGTDAHPRYIVYLAGTITFDPRSGTETHDMKSNAHGVAAQESEAQRAVETAMRQAGVRPGDEVLLVGHSQGALVASRIAQEREFAVAGVVTVGGPTAQIAMPEGLPVLAVEHGEDAVPALGGLPVENPGRVLVERNLYDDAPAPAGTAIPAHSVAEYGRTLALAESSGSTRVAGFTAAIAPFLHGRGTVTTWRADRIRPPHGGTGEGTTRSGPRR